ncbi:uncharacterized protein LOC129601969 [Paramacrobiotus metropolitanus]|uniref:uncharacterized protein LOC129601969 n=1 Tax=Paramacrobiotus metropolitanus TaxID=2943436 RepID=UPI002445EB27|nr:uncharacterized protein LOC129601969 [Paramacrobiotus metropolitanus]XP_055356874.1 uncharacterized protein LOC129601969 [Paramacrobiotus metropolitanus]
MDHEKGNQYSSGVSSPSCLDDVEQPIPAPFPTPTEESHDSAEPAPTNPKRLWVLSIIMLLLYVTLGTGAAQLTNLAFADTSLHFKAPYLFTMIKMMFRAQALTFYFIGNTCTKLLRRRKIDLAKTWRRCKSIIGEDGITWRLVVYRFGPAAIFNLAVQILYTLSMANLTASVATALSAPSVAVSYLFSWFFLKQPALALKILFVGVAFAGVGLITYDSFAKTITTSSVVGIVCVLLSDLCLSSYQLAFKKAFPKGDFGQVSFAVTGMFLVMCLIYWPVPVALKCTGVEVYDIRLLPYGILFGAWICSSLAALVYGYGLVLSTPFFMSLSELLIMVTNIVFDSAVRKVSISAAQIGGSLLIGVAFIVVILPDNLLRIRKLFRCFYEDTQPASVEAGELKPHTEISCAVDAASNTGADKTKPPADPEKTQDKGD